jgi:bacteriocin biosynthesis cyclodehydratase domain-containing protein
MDGGRPGTPGSPATVPLASSHDDVVHTAVATEVVLLPDDAVQIRGAFGSKTVRRSGRALASVLDVLRTPTRRRDAARILGDALDAPGEAFLLLLERNGLMACGNVHAEPVRALQALRSQTADLGPRPGVAEPLAVLGSGRIADTLVDILRRADVACGPVEVGQLTAGTAAVVCSDRDDPAFFREVNRSLLETAPFVLFVATTPTAIRLGPFVRPGATACLECHHVRNRTTASHLAEFDAHASRRAADDTCPISPFLTTWAAHQAAIWLMSALHGAGQPSSPAEIWETSPLSGRTEVATVLRVPSCAACGALA